ncbi:lymphocyte expansion molecule-like isoform X2 [Pseudomyrmex gracilis]|nr:lymphocyte expansion molecule-like isoform X2 [Pseudomyrmex gracilis]
MGGLVGKKEIAFQRFLMRTGLGPGTHEILRWPENILEATCKISREDVKFGTVPRFEPAYKSTTPGPGYTLRTHNPFYYLEQKALKGFSQVPTFEFDGLTSRFRETRKSWSLACNRYNVKYPTSMQAFLEKVTSKRGPYDLFTGPRDESTIRGYWARARVQDYEDWPKKLPSEMEKLSSKSNYFKGKWSTNPRFIKKPVSRIMLQDINTCYKDPDQPGPGHYYLRAPRKPSSLKKYPFDSNVKIIRPLPSRDFLPGPGRYKIKEDYRIKGSGWTCVFKSKVPRTIASFVAPSYSHF